MLKSLIIIYIMFTFLVAKETDYTCYDKWPNASPPYHFTPNKCGPDSPLAKYIPNKFGSVNLASSCNQHDRCWMELEHLNQYGKCELQFTKDLIKACSKAEMCFGRYCVSSPIEIGACESMIVPSYTAAASGGILLNRLKKSRKEQKMFERCIAKHGYNKRIPINQK